MSKIEIPAGYEVTFGGQSQMMAEMNKTILGILIFAFLLSFIVLAVQFNSFRLPGLILGCVPFCISGIYDVFHGVASGSTCNNLNSGFDSRTGQ